MTSKSPILSGNAALCGKANMQKQHGKTHTKMQKVSTSPPQNPTASAPIINFQIY
jgi:hypothetical protein